MLLASNTKMDNTNVVSADDNLIEMLLCAWGMPQIVQTFKDKEIDTEVFLQLTQNDAKEILEDFALGIKLKFWKKYAKWNKNTVNFELQEKYPNPIQEKASENSNEMEEQDESAQVNLLSSKSTTSSKESDESNYILDSDNDLKSSDSESYQVSSKMETKKRQNKASADGSTSAKKKKIVNPNMLAEKKITAFSASNELMDLDLKELLGQCLEGKAVLQTYEINEYLEEEDRTVLVDIVVKWLLFRITQPKKPELTILKDKILTLFTNEENVYYIAPKEEGDNQCLARGKLYDRTKNLKEWMRKKNLLPKVQTCQKNAYNDLSAAEKAQTEPTNNVKIALNWLKSFHEPWHKVEEKWTATSKYRRDVLIASRSQAKQQRTECTKAAAYLDEYKVLRLSQGYTLIEIDFTLSCQPGFEDELIMNWHSFIKKIDSVLRNSPELVKDPKGKMLRQLYLKANKESKDILLMQCLPSLLPPSRQVQLGRKKFKPTIKESRDAFIVNVQIPGQVVNFIAERRTKICNTFGRSASVQPYILYVGKELDVVDEIIVVIDDFNYKLGSFQQALDVCFKTFIALDMVFTAQCDHIWLLIQKALYGFSTRDDVNILKVTSFLKKLELMDKES